MRLRLALLFVGISGLACGGIPDVQGSLGTTCASDTPVTTVDLAEVDGPIATPSDGILLEVTAEAYRVGGEETDTLQALSEAQERASELADAAGTEASSAVNLAVAADVTGARLVEALDALDAVGVSEVRFLLRSPKERASTPYLDPGYANVLRARLADVDPAQRQTVLAAEVDSLLVACPGGQKAFSAVAYAAPDMRCKLMVAGLEEALPSCPLTDGIQVVTALQVMFEPPLFELVTLELKNDAAAEPFEVAPDAPWSDIAPLWLPRSGTSAHFVPEGAAAPPAKSAGPAPTPTPAQSPSAQSGKVQISGTLDKGIIGRVLARNRNQVRACYEQALARDASTSGSLLLKLTIDADGRVSAAKAEADTAGDAELTSCVLASAKKLRFPASKGTTAVDLPLVFQPG